MKKNRPTERHARAFDDFMHKWQQRLNLGDWRIERIAGRSPGAIAEVNNRLLADRLATYRLGDDFGSMPINDETLERAAIHEIGHIFLHELVELARDPNTTADVLMSAEHRIINVLEGLLICRPHPST